MKTYQFAYGSGTVEFPLEEKNIIGELHGNVVEPISDIRKELWASLDAPIDSAPLCRRVTPGSTVALVGCPYERSAVLEALRSHGIDGAVYRISAEELSSVVVD